MLVHAVTPTDRPNMVRNRRVIKVFDGVFVLSLDFYFLMERVLCLRTGSDLFLCLFK